MFIIDKNNIPEDIVKDDVRFDETTYLLFSQHQLQIDELDDYFQKYNKQSNLSKLLEKSYDLKRYFEDIDSRSLKANNSTFIRYFMKNLKKKVNFQFMGQNNTKRMVSLLISEIVLEACENCFQNLFREKYMDLFEATVESGHLQDEFEKIVIQLFQPMWDGLTDEMSDKLYGKFTLYRKIHGKYLVELALENPDSQKLGKYKKQIQDIIEMDEDDADKKAYAMEKKLDDEEKEFNRILSDRIDHNDMLEKENKKAKKYLETDFLRVNDDNVLQLIEEHQDEIKESHPKKNEDRMRKIYQQYFLYEQDDYDVYYNTIGKMNEMLLNASQMKMNYFVDYFYVFYLSNIIDDIDDKFEAFLMINNYCDEITELVNNFLHLLSFHLWNAGDEEKIYQRIEAFQKIIDEIPKCHEMFLELREDPESEDYSDLSSVAFDFTPQHLYYNHIVMAVITNIDIPAVSRRLKSLILSFYQSFDLMEKSKKYTQIYDEGIRKDDFKTLHECADLFILSYLKDKRLIASYSPFLRYFHDYYFDVDNLASNDEEQTLFYLNEQIDYDLKYKKKLIQTKKKFDLLLDELHHYQDKVVLKKLNRIEDIMNISSRSMYFFNPIVDKENILKKYRYRLITYLANYTQDFFDQSLDEKIDQLLCVCWFYHYIETIEQYEQYMPRKQQILHEEYVQSLKSIIEDKEHIIDIKNKQINQINSKKKTKKNKQNNKLFEEEIKYYKQEISILNKQLKNKYLEIENLKKNQTELYKLRELIFEMQQDDEEKQHKISIDLHEVIKDKTIIIIGGHISLRDRLKQKYPTLKILSESSHITDAVLLHADHVFMFHKFMTHDMYNRAISVLSRNNIPWDYIPYTNLEKSEEVIYHVLKD